MAGWLAKFAKSRPLLLDSAVKVFENQRFRLRLSSLVEDYKDERYNLLKVQ